MVAFASVGADVRFALRLPVTLPAVTASVMLEATIGPATPLFMAAAVGLIWPPIVELLPTI